MFINNNRKEGGTKGRERERKFQTVLFYGFSVDIMRNFDFAQNIKRSEKEGKLQKQKAIKQMKKNEWQSKIQYIFSL